MNSQLLLNVAKVIYFKVLVQIILELSDETWFGACYKDIIYINYKNNCVNIDVSKIEIKVGL